MAAQRTSKKRLQLPNRRTRVVWATFIGAMTLVTGALALRDAAPQGGFVLTNLDLLGAQPEIDPVFQLARPLDRARWTGIVIHHLGEPAGTAESVARMHSAAGLTGLGYHFLIGNGNGLADGAVHVGYRWNEQLPGAHVVGTQGEHHNQRSIGICLIGNGDRRPFTDAQIAQLVRLVRRLQAELGVPARNLYLHRDLAEGVASPGRYFPVAQLQEQLLRQ